MKDWANFLEAIASASAALTGLVFVGLSINLTKILSIRVLPDRALEALLLLLSALVVSTLLLVPGQPHQLLGSEVIVLGLLVWVCITALNRRIARHIDAQYRRASLLLICLSQVAVLSYVVAGVLLVLRGVEGMYAVVPALLLSIVKANLDAWVLLVEINR